MPVDFICELAHIQLYCRLIFAVGLGKNFNGLVFKIENYVPVDHPIRP